MATYNLNVTASVDLLGSDISGSQSTDFAIANPLPASSYFTFETVRNSDGFYDTSSPKNMAGTYTLGAGLAGLVKSDYIASVVVEPGGGTLTFVPTNYISGSSLNLRGTSAPPLPVSGGFDIDAQAFITAAGITDATQQNAINTLVVDLKADGIWSKMKAIYPFVGGTASTHKYNLKDPRDLDAAFRLVFNGGWTHSSTGATPNGTNGYADTKLNPNLFTANSSHLSYYSRTNNYSATLSREIGVNNSGSYNPEYSIRMSDSNSGGGALGDYNIFSSFSTTNSDYFAMMSRVNSTSLKSYKNGTLQNTRTGTNTLTSSSLSIYIGATNFGGSAARYSNRQTAFASIGDGLSDTEASNLYTAVQAFQTSLSRQV